MSNEQYIWNRLIASGMTPEGAAGVIGNLYAESLLNPKNLQNSYEKSLGFNDETYTASVDNGSYKNFVKDQAGYGIAQWTFWVRKENLLNFAKSRNVSIGDLGMQVDFLLKELKEDYTSLFNALCKVIDVKAASDAVMLQFERPADVSNSARNKRAEFSQKYYDMFSSETSYKKPTKELIDEIFSGKWGNGAERKTRLIAAGYDYDEVQSMVNESLSVTVDESYEKPERIRVTVILNDGPYSGVLEKGESK